MPRFAVALAAAILLAGCRIENRAPAGSLRDDQAIRGAVAAFYRGTAAADWPAVRALFWDSASVQRGAHEGGEWMAFESADDFRLWLGAGRMPALEPVRVEPRQDGDLAGVWVTTRRAGTERGTASVDHFLLRRMGDGWRITGYVSAEVSAPGGAR
jgi:hypothetical protein